MKLAAEDICAFDECSILHLCSITIPKNYRIFCSKDIIHFENFKKLDNLIKNIKELNTFPFMFNPCKGLDNNLLTALN